MKIPQKTIIKFNKRFARGEQYIAITQGGQIEETTKAYFWQEREVYNQLANIVDYVKAKAERPLTDRDLYGRGGLVDLLVPYQRAYNAIMNRQVEYGNRLAYGVLAVEDGSVDCDNLEEEGLAPGKILVYRQGAQPPIQLKYSVDEYDKIRDEVVGLREEMWSFARSWVAYR